MANIIMTVEQFEKFATTLPENVDRRKVAKAMGIELSVEVKPLSEQLKNVGLVKHTPKQTKKNVEPCETLYVEVPSLKLGQNSGTKGFWVKACVARKIAEQIISVCNQNKL